jgi:hypothetical protein
MSTSSTLNMPKFRVHKIGYERKKDVFITQKTSSTSSEETLTPKSKKFERNLLELLIEESVEDGCTHPAEAFLEKSLKTNREAALWIQSVFIDNHKKPVMATGILKCIGRLHPSLVGSWGKLMAKTGLSEPSLEIRDAAVTALELWGDSESLGILKDHIESTPWLARYIKQVIEDLSR